jgi:glycosyltransferase involved in cell wall biosynthesis
MKVSVVISTRNRAYAIIPCLASIDTAARKASLADAEIVVVDNGSDDDTPSLIRSWAISSFIPVRLEYEPRAGITIAKNRGLRSARGDILVLTDDDCRLREDYFLELLRLDAADGELALRGGRVELGDSADLPLTIKTDADRRQWHLSNNSARYENLGNCFPGCNLFMRRAVYERLGPFDERFGVGSLPASEDTEYIFRAYTNGIKIEYIPDIVLFHHHGRRSPADAQLLFRKYMIGSGGVYAKYLFTSPSLCRQVGWDIKDLVREIFNRRNLLLPEFGFSYADKVRYNILGALLYYRSVLRQRLNIGQS